VVNWNAETHSDHYQDQVSQEIESRAKLVLGPSKTDGAIGIDDHSLFTHPLDSPSFGGPNFVFASLNPIDTGAFLLAG
jgi:hypothetical protein